MVLRLGTRGSLLAKSQSGLIAKALERAHPGLRVELVEIKTSGDRIQDRPLNEFGGKGLFTKEIELALLGHQIDFAVHSFKDVPVTMPLVDQSNLIIAAVPKRESPWDVLVSLKGQSIGELSQGAKVGTGSPRRRAQILAMRADLNVEGIRGNIDTRIRKLKEGSYDAIVLALAGVRRAGLFDPGMMFELRDLIPAAGQGALALQCRREDGSTHALLARLNDEETARCVEAERAIVQALNGDCHSPIAAFASSQDGVLHIRAAVGARDGNPPVVQATGQTVEHVVAQLESRGARKLLQGP
jgi:hydroxymethylbilane synthase